MTMTAQYRPYRDEDCVDGAESEHIGWHDHEPGVQIYEKTTEDVPLFAGRRRWFYVSTAAAAMAAMFVCFIIGFYAHSTHSNCILSTTASLDSIHDVDATIRAKLLARIDSAEIEKSAREYSTRPHIAGSDEDLRLANRILDFFTSNRFDRPTIKKYDVLLSLPDAQKPNYVSILNEAKQEIFSSLNSSQYRDGFSPYSPKGSVTGDVMFINYGRPVDYLQLQELFNTSENIFKDKILLAKQFHVSASEQYKYAMIMNASALLLYPDPQHYNPKNVKPYPESEWLPPDGVRSDSIFWNGAGDPQTFGLPSNAHAFKDSLDFTDQVRIPAQPISYAMAYEIFRHLQGVDAPPDWRGGFNLTYKVGPGLRDNHRLHVRVNNQLVNRTIRNVFGTIRGRVEPDRYVIVGNQRDSSSCGAIDAAAGIAAFLEIARAFATLVHDDIWRPRRSIVFASWGAEEFNLLGSTEWVEEMSKILNARAVAYVNVNLLVTGNSTLNVAASPLLYHAIFNATKEVFLPQAELEKRPEGFHSVYDKWLSSQPVMRNVSSLILNQDAAMHLERIGVQAKSWERDPHHFRREEASEPGNILRTYLESAITEIRPHIRSPDMYGSYAPFVSMAGVPTIDLNFVKQNLDDVIDHSTRATSENGDDSDYEKFAFSHMPYPLLHTQYDEVHAIERFIDPQYQYHRMAAQILAEITRDLADSLFLPFNIFDYAQLLKDFYVKSTHLHNLIIKEYRSIASNDHPNLELMNQLDLKSLNSAIHNFTDEAIRFHARQDTIDTRDPMAIRRVNDQLMLLERQFLDHRGIPSNNLKRHLVLSPAETLSSFNALETEGLFPALLDELDQIVGNVFKRDVHHSLMRLQKHLPILINTIQSAAELLTDM